MKPVRVSCILQLAVVVFNWKLKTFSSGSNSGFVANFSYSTVVVKIIKKQQKQDELDVERLHSMVLREWSRAMVALTYEV
jgi:hypothetical protein